jgi:hypothetical protein
MNKRCPNCSLINFLEAEYCRRCDFELKNLPVPSGPPSAGKRSMLSKIVWRAVVCIAVCFLSIFGFYLSLVLSSSPLGYEEKTQVRKAIQILTEKGFHNEVFLLNYLTSFRGNDHWLNASVEKENAYAATNYPFEIMTIYPDFFAYTIDDTERAAILLHEAKHLQGQGESEAYEFVWKNRHRLGWTKDKYAGSIIWQNVRKQTREAAPNLFVCQGRLFHDCTENPADFGF